MLSWMVFIRHYLPELQARRKWQNPSADITPGTVVMLVDLQSPHSFWQIGKVVNVFPGADDRVRMAEVQIKNNFYSRPITRPIVLPEIRNEGDDIHTKN